MLVVRVRPTGELVVGGTEVSGGGWASAGLYVAECKWVDGGGVGDGGGGVEREVVLYK